jgi:5-oxoprolinase (ATP-hydrolysing) subunit C
MIEILSPGALCTVQDLGRYGSLQFGVGTAGAMDDLALQAGNLMVGNAPDAAGIEVPVLPFQVQFRTAMDFAVTGADGGCTLAGQPLPPWWASRARAGDVLTLGGHSGRIQSGARCYLTVAGGIDVPVVLGSRSTQLRGQFGGWMGRPLARGDVLPVGAPRGDGASQSALPTAGFGILPAGLALPQRAFCEAAGPDHTAVRVVPAAEYEEFDVASLEALWGTDWKITSQSDRYGYRLSGTRLARQRHTEIRSHGIVPGVIQVPHGGQPIIQMRDAQPSGGYPKIGTVIDADLWRLAQAPAGSRLRFVQVSYEQAVAALQPIQDYLSKVRHLADLYRQRYGQQPD